ncbi:MAG: D-aminoacyl-tRNA deacylase [Verrucomicrobiota bacterium]
MRALLQRVSSASVNVGGETIASIQHGLLILLGIEEADDASDIDWLCGKISRLRIFEDEEGKMNRSIQDINGEVIVVSQFTLHASTKKGNRPSFLKSAAPTISEPLYQAFCLALETELGKSIGRGIFGAEMQVSLINSGPVTIWIDSRDRE